MKWTDEGGDCADCGKTFEQLVGRGRCLVMDRWLCPCGKVVNEGDDHSCRFSATPRWSKVPCPVCDGSGCDDCNQEGRVWPERYEKIANRYEAFHCDGRWRVCLYCGAENAIATDAFGDDIGYKCREAERAEMKAAEARADELYFTTNNGE